MPLAVLIGIAFTAVALMALCATDPKRRRTARLATAIYGGPGRGVLVIGSLLPGLAFILAGQGAALLIWMGGSAMAGWSITMLFSHQLGR